VSHSPLSGLAGKDKLPEYFNTATAQATVEQINQFIGQSTERQLVINSINGTLAVLGLIYVALPFIALGALVLIFWR
jgi:hypothetical protein